MVGPNREYPFGHGQNDYHIDQPEAVGTLVETRLKMTLGEYFLNKNDGTDYMGKVLGNNTSGTRDLVIQDRILNTQGVSEITSYNAVRDPNTRALTQSATISTVYSATPVTIAVPS